ncbi:MAG: GtrA family protein [Acidobacteriaceae bacterium]|nr:GtrA family protein [Acidobacteriaceae bacterium]
MSKDSSRTLSRLQGWFPAGQVLRYLVVGAVNTLSGYALYALFLWALNRITPAHWLYLTVIAASVISTPINITVSYFNYKWFVFRTKGNHLREWIKAFGVYGVSMLPGLLALSLLTRALQWGLHGYQPFGKATAGYLAGAITTGISTVFSFLGHRHVTFKSGKTSSIS